MSVPQQHQVRLTKEQEEEKKKQAQDPRNG
jgi:hypothetical protein